MQRRNFYLSFLLLFVLLTAEAQEEQLCHDSMMYYYGKNNFPKAIFWAEKKVSALKNRVGESDTAYGAALNDLGAFYYSNGNYYKAKPLYLQAADIYKNKVGENNHDYMTMLNNLGNACKHISEFAEAEKYYNTSLRLMRENGDTTTIDYPLGLNNLAYLYNELGNVTTAETLFLQALNTYKQIIGEQNAGYARTIDNLGTFYLGTGQYSKAETYLRQGLALRKKVVGEDSWEYGASMNNLAKLYYVLGDYKTARPLFEQSLEIVKKQLGETHIQYGIAVVNVSSLYNELGLYQQAEHFMEIGASVIGDAVGKNSIPYANCINNLAGIYYRTGNDTAAFRLYTEAMTIRKKLLGAESFAYAASLNNIANWYAIKGMYSVADSLRNQAISISERLEMNKSPDYLTMLRAACELNILSGKYARADGLIQKVLENERTFLISKLNFLSEAELLASLPKEYPAFNLPFALLCWYTSPALLQNAYDSRLLLKNIGMENSQNLNRQIALLQDTLLSTQWLKYKSGKMLLNKLMASPKAQRYMSTDSLEEIIKEQERQLLQESSAFRNTQEKLSITWREVHSNLKTSETAMEFIHYNSIKNFQVKEDTFFYAALLLRPQDTVPIFVKICDEEQLKKALQVFQYKTPGNYKPETKSKEASQDIYNLIWQPLEKYLTETHTVYFSPDGLLHQIAFAAIPYKNGLLCDKYNLVQLTSTRQIATKDPEPQPSFAALFGGVNYNRQTTDTTPVHPDAYAYVYRQNRSANIDSFNYLPGTVQEVSYIKKDLTTQNKTVYLFSGTHATEAAFRHLGDSTSPQIIHFATHGFTLPDPVKNIQAGDGSNVFKISDNPLLRCGLVMAGGNKGWKGKSSPEEDDGILTGLEISNVSLLNTQLAVLSACETGTGQLMGTEGVFGLQRAFKLAGVNYVMASLWPVPDKETTEFMKYFYDNLSGGKSIRQSFISTQQTMRKKYSPYYWAAFTLVQ